jgi:putative transposase
MSNKTDYLASVNAYFHVYNRGIDHAPIFFSNRNYRYFLTKMRSAVLQESNVQLVANCLMPNHFHILLQQKAEHGMSAFMSHVCNGYAKAVNSEQNRSGHLLEGKYKLKSVDDNRYLLHLSRYIHLNPVRAKLAASVEEWPYSSYGEYIHPDTNSTIVHPEIILNQFANTNEYRTFVEEYQIEDKTMIQKFLF